MEYIFGTNQEKETMRTKSTDHTDLTGFCQTVKEFPNEKITDHFHIVRKIKSEDGVDGSAYDWYEIDQHYRYVDKTPALMQAKEKNAANIDYLSMMMNVELP